ncbi:MAG: hypothetical protein AAGB19_22850, partial [Cyanobacteria bacterium P01_F01_bin.3]
MESPRQHHSKTAKALYPRGCGLFIFTRFPMPGQAKTRMIPLLGDESVLRLPRRHLRRRRGRGLQGVPRRDLFCSNRRHRLVD